MGKEVAMFIDALKNVVGQRVRICTFEATNNGVIEDVSDDAIKFRPDLTETAVFLLKPDVDNLGQTAIKLGGLFKLHRKSPK